MTLRSDAPKYVYVASSWRNPLQPAVCAALRSVGIEHYDFRNPADDKTGFHWSEVMPSYKAAGGTHHEQLARMDEYIQSLSHPVAKEGYRLDFDAMVRADAFVLILPSGRSAHLEMGWACGTGVRRTCILLDGDLNDGLVTPELMYKMVDHISPSFMDLLDWLGVED